MELECSCTRTKTSIGPKTWRPFRYFFINDYNNQSCTRFTPNGRVSFTKTQKIRCLNLLPSNRALFVQKATKKQSEKAHHNQPCVVTFTFEPPCWKLTNNQPITHVDIPKSSLPCFLASFPAHTRGKQSRKQLGTSCPAIKK